MTLVQFRLNLLFLWHSWAHLQISLKSANGANRFIKDWWASYFVSPHTKNYGIFRKVAATTEYSSSNGLAAYWEGLIWPGYNRPNCSLMSVMTGQSLGYRWWQCGFLNLLGTRLCDCIHRSRFSGYLFSAETVNFPFWELICTSSLGKLNVAVKTFFFHDRYVNMLE